MEAWLNASVLDGDFTMKDGSPYYLLLLPLAAVFFCWILASVSGWTRLAVNYRSKHRVTGERACMRTARIGPVNYHSVLSFCCTEEGLQISIAFPFRFGHPPLFIPWDDFYRVAPDNKIFSNRIKASIGSPELSRLVLPAWVRYRMPMGLRGISEE